MSTTPKPEELASIPRGLERDDPSGASRVPEHGHQPLHPARQHEGEKAFRLSTTDMVEYLSEKAADRIEGRFRERNQLRLRNLAIVLSAIGVIGFGTVASTASLIVQNMVDAAVVEATASLRSDLATETAYQQLVTLAFAISEGDSFTIADRDRVMNILREIGTSENVKQRPGFSRYLEQTVDSFFEANLTSDIDDIDDLFRDVLTSYSGTAATLVNHYGLQVVGSPLRIQDQDNATVERFRAYAAAAESHQYPELALLWRLLVEFKASEKQKTTTADNLVHDIGFLSADDRGLFYKHLTRFTKPSERQSAESERTARVASLVGELLTVYPELLNQAAKSAG